MTLRSWDHLARRYARLVFSIPRSHGLSQEDAEDVFQTTWQTALAKRDRPPAEREFVRWIASIAFWKTRGRLRDTARQARLVAQFAHESEPESLAPQDVILQAEREQLVRDALESLPARDRALVGELFLAPVPISYEDLAALLGVAGGSVGPLRGRALERLRRALARRGVFS